MKVYDTVEGGISGIYIRIIRAVTVVGNSQDFEVDVDESITSS